MGEHEDAVLFHIGKMLWREFGRRDVTHCNAVDLSSLEQDANSLDGNHCLHDGRLIAVLGGYGIEIVGDPVCSSEACKDRQSADDGEFGTRCRFGKGGQRCHQAADPWAFQAKLTRHV